MKASPKKMGRLALREEGEFWNAYYALEGTMEGAIPLGSIRMGAVRGNPELKQQFMDLMKDTVSGLIEDIFKQRPEWNNPTPASECERSGNA